MFMILLTDWPFSTRTEAPPAAERKLIPATIPLNRSLVSTWATSVDALAGALEFSIADEIRDVSDIVTRDSAAAAKTPRISGK